MAKTKERKPLAWPPKVGKRICFDTGHAHNSWSGEVRAVVDDDVAIVRYWRKHKGWHSYRIVEKLDVEIMNDAETAEAILKRNGE
jgi:hypothetical protein